jgi:hypothetical protein
VPRNMRGTMRTRSNASRFAVIVVSRPAPPAMYAKPSRVIARSAARSSATAFWGTPGLWPRKPAR